LYANEDQQGNRMSITAEEIEQSPQDAPRCPIDHRALSLRKTAQTAESATQPVEQDREGVWHVRGYEQARAILRSDATKQAGFNAELLERLPQRMNPPILYQEGAPHHEQRRQTARFFTPKTVSANYRALMEGFAERTVARLRHSRKADLSELSMKLAVRVAGEVVGLTNSVIPGMDRRLNAFFSHAPQKLRMNDPRAWLAFVRNQRHMWAFFYLDVKPAIAARRKAPREDVISHLIGRGASDTEILTECVTYGAAGMATTREFISVAAWHLLEQPGLRDAYLAGDEDERQQMLGEILRLEPVVGHLFRRATADFEIEVDGNTITITAGSLIDLHLYAVNADETVVGDHPLLICPDREIRSERVGPAVMSFGDGHHRCPGAYIALQETDIFLRKLLALPTLRIAQKPSVSWNSLIQGYEIRRFLLAVD
jgi:cytochrome P450